MLDNDCRVLLCHSMICGLSLSTRPFVSAVKQCDEETPATWVVADRNTIGSSVSDEMKKLTCYRVPRPPLYGTVYYLECVRESAQSTTCSLEL